MIAIIGLGNPEEKYAYTRHNLGFNVIDLLKKEMGFPDFSQKKKFFSELSEGKINQSRVVLVKPQTFMNESGRAAGAVAAYYKIKPDNIWVVYDDKDLPLGALRIRKTGGSAGHKGIESAIHHLKKKEFVRFRIGTAPSKKFIRATTNFVLGKFSGQEKKTAEEMIKKTVQAIQVALNEGIDKAINKKQVSNI